MRNGLRSWFFSLGCFCCSCIGLYATQDSFIISQEKDASKKNSKNELKENVGEKIKETLLCCSELSKQIGTIQIELAQIQKTLYEKIEELVDNRPPFKNAKKGELLDAINVMRDAKKELENQIENVKKLSAQMNQTNCLKQKNEIKNS